MKFSVDSELSIGSNRTIIFETKNVFILLKILKSHKYYCKIVNFEVYIPVLIV